MSSETRPRMRRYNKGDKTMDEDETKEETTRETRPRKRLHN